MVRVSQLPAAGMGWQYVLGEVIELWEEILKLDTQGMLSEACDVYTCASCAVLTTTGIDLPILWTRSAKVWLHRIEAWKLILAEEGLGFKVEYLRYGSNYDKPEKIEKVLALARQDQL